MKGKISVLCVTGEDVSEYFEEIATLRTQVFREYPYLYDGNMEYEKEYLQPYLASDKSIAVLGFCDNLLVGVSTGVPLTDEADDMQRPFRNQGYDITKIFYYGESVVLPEYRGYGLGKQFFQAREAHARRCDHFNLLSFFAVNRPENHPRRPKDYRPLNGYWEQQGFKEIPSLQTTFTWQDLDEQSPSPKQLTSWAKPLE